jgi:hypothetical protein
MANTVDELSTAIKCIDLLGQNDKQAAKVYFLLADAVDNGTVPSNDLDALYIAAACYLKFSETELDSAFAAVAGQKALANGAAVDPTDIDSIATAIKCLKLKSPHELRVYELYLRDQLTQS